jgi:hypothetical protein
VKPFDKSPKPPSVPLFWEPEIKKEKDEHTVNQTAPRPKEDEKSKALSDQDNGEST